MTSLSSLPLEDLEELRRAKTLLERPGLAAKLAGLVGVPFERGARLLPARARETLAALTEQVIWKALGLSLESLGKATGAKPHRRWHQVAGGLFGAAGGMFGLAALAVELPATTVLILRSIAEIARAHGEDLDDTEAQLACVQVFALGGFSAADDATEAGYYATRAALASTVSEAVKHVARHGLGHEGAPAFVRLVTGIAARFGIVVTDKALLTALPIVGAAAGAAVNAVFLEHFQRVAEGHFTLRRLERRHGAALVRDEYDRLGRPGGSA